MKRLNLCIITRQGDPIFEKVLLEVNIFGTLSMGENWNQIGVTLSKDHL